MVIIFDNIGQLGLLFQRPDFSSADISALIKQINANIFYILDGDSFKKERGTFRDQLTDSVISAIAVAREEHKNHEQLRDGLNAIMDKKTGLAILQGGIRKKSSMKKLEEIRNELDNFIKERDENLLTLIRSEKSKEARAAINAGAKVDWAIFFNGNADVDKGPLKIFFDLLKENIQDLVGRLSRPEVRSLIDVVNQKTKYFSREPRFGLAREAITDFFHQGISENYILRPSEFPRPKDHLRGVKVVSEVLDLVHWDVPKKKLSSDLLEDVKTVLDCRLEKMNSELMQFVSEENWPMVKDRVRSGAEVNYVNSIGETPLSKAILGGNLKMIRLLLKRGASLIEAGADINWHIIKEKVSKEQSALIRVALITSIHFDLWEINNKGVNLVLIDAVQRKLDFLKRDNEQPVVLPSDLSCYGVVELFIQHRDAVPPLDYELLLKFQQLLIGLGVDAGKIRLKEPGPIVNPEVPDAEGYTPLMNAARFGRYEEAKAILDEGVTVDWQALLLKLFHDGLVTKLYQREYVYTFLKSVSLLDIDALVASSGEEDTDRLIEKLNNQTAPMVHRVAYRNDLYLDWIRNRLVSIFREKNGSKGNPNLLKVLDKVLASLLFIQGKGSVNGIKKSMHALQLLRIKIASQHKEESAVEDKSEDMPTIPRLTSDPFFNEFAEVKSLTDVSDDKVRDASRSIREAIMRRDLDNLKLLIDEHPECIDRPDIDGFPPLLAASRENSGSRYTIDMNDEILPYLIQRGAKIDWVAFSAVEPAMFNSFRQAIIYFLSSVVHGEIKELFKFENEDAVQALIKRINNKTQHLDIDVGSIARANIRTNFIFQLHQKKQEIMVSKDISFLTATLKNLDYIAREMHIIQRTARDGKKDKHAMRELKLFINTTRAAISELNFQALLHLTNAEAINTKINAMNEEISSLDTLDIKHLREEISPSFIDILKKRRADFSNVIAEPVLQSAYDSFNQVLNGLVIIQSSDERAMNAVRKNLNSLIEHLKGRLDKLAGADKFPAGRRPTVFRDANDQEKKDRKEQSNTGFNDTSIFEL